MRRIHIFSIALFIVAVAVFGLYQLNARKIQDQKGPEITMDATSITVSVNATEEELLAGVTAVDEKDGDVSHTLLVENMSNFIEPGRRNITIAAFDEDNHVTKTTRELIYTDYQSPTFQLESPLKFPRNTKDVLEGVTVEDVLDGNLTSNIKISTDYVISVDEAGEYPVVFKVANSAGDIVELPVTVTIYDSAEESQKPQIHLSRYILYTKVGVPVNPWLYVKQIDIGNQEFVLQEDGVLRDIDPAQGQSRTSITKEEVTMTHQIDYNTPGVYEITYQMDVEGREPGTVRMVVVVR